MWKKIEKSAQAFSLKRGTLLTQDPETDEDIFEIVQINMTTNYITLMTAKGKTQVKFLPADELIKKKWWVKEK